MYWSLTSPPLGKTQTAFASSNIPLSGTLDPDGGGFSKSNADGRALRKRNKKKCKRMLSGKNNYG